MTSFLFVFTFRNKMTLEESPFAISFAPTLAGAEEKVRKYFPKYLYDKVTCMQITNKNFVGILAYDNLNLDSILHNPLLS